MKQCSVRPPRGHSLFIQAFKQLRLDYLSMYVILLLKSFITCLESVHCVSKEVAVSFSWLPFAACPGAIPHARVALAACQSKHLSHHCCLGRRLFRVGERRSDTAISTVGCIDIDKVTHAYVWQRQNGTAWSMMCVRVCVFCPRPQRLS